MRCGWICVFLALVAKSTVVWAERLGGEAFTDPGIFWQSVPSDWIQRPIKPEAEAQRADLAITLDQQLYPSLLPLIQTFAETHGLTVAVTRGTCGISAGLLLRKAADIGGFCCAPGRMDRLPGLRFHTLAIAAVALFVHPDNLIEELTLPQARDLFRGGITDWSRLVATLDPKVPHPVHPIGRLHCKRRPGHWRLLLDSEELFSPELLEVGAIEDMVRMAAIDPKAIGYETLWMIRNHQTSGKVKPLRLNGVSPDNAAALVQGRYPLYRVYNVTTWEGVAAKPRAKELVRHLQDRIQELDSRFFMVPVTWLRTQGWQFEGDELIGEPEVSSFRESQEGYPEQAESREPQPAQW